MTYLYLKHGLNKLLVVGPRFGYYPQLSKSNLNVKKTLMSSAEQSISSSRVSVVQSGKHLGGVIGDQAITQYFMTSKVCVHVVALYGVIVLYCCQSTSSHIHSVNQVAAVRMDIFTKSNI